ncbi:sulfite exporter TauE/SafE family protein, partial [Actinoplanes sp. NPDC051633]|uniref:sulfite exporter TauE/SafE family protein n=1 Tax=Actinoplanes sp. NPDC051633 TaxID=3155670 RepID=UPI0034412EA0
MGLDQVVLLVLGGAGSGLTGSMAGLASLISYPTLLAVGLSPIAANVTNTVALFANTAGAAAGSRRELRGQGGRVLRLGAVATIGGAAGAVLLLSTPPSAFERIVPWLIALAAVALLFRDPLRARLTRAAGLPLTPLIFLIAIYSGYFGAAAGVLMLTVLSLSASEPLAVSNAVKNVVSGISNLTAAVIYAFVAPVHWPAALLLGAGCLLGAWIGPAIVRRLPEKPLRAGIAL